MPYIQLNGLEMFYEKMGSGEPLIFLHSAYSRGILAFASQILDFQNAYTCYFPDFRGHGRTRCESLAWSTPQLADDITVFMEQMDIPKAHFISYSLGAGAAMYVAVNAPERVFSMTAIGCSGFNDPSGADEYEPEALIAQGKHAAISQMIERHEDAHRGNWQEFMRQSAADWRLFPQLSEEQIRSIRCPALFIAGEHDPYVKEAQLKHLNSLVKNSEYLVVPGGSRRPHMLRENPVLVNDAILQFLKLHPIADGYS
ncbi:alpha/beta fold hydrolase [Paenibacillus sp. S150]|uniref:alpha/beta fold hydrolase n=1 Tax=Paenibacillus sp. S150 TaxID=2749826 RepID=UPI001C563C47|nr:alpha/beta hydrolase [Paenibacillus sp. S150]MBW4082269.1 alpha/beta hydrolase [Paenibacillus sp. S150]